MSCCSFLCCNDVIRKFEKGTKMDSLKEIYIDRVITLTSRTYKPKIKDPKIVYKLHDILNKIIIDEGIKQPTDIITIRNTIATLANIDDWFDYDGDCDYSDDEIIKGAKYLLVKMYIL